MHQYRKGPNAVRTGHTAAFASLDLRLEEGRGKGPGPGPKSDTVVSDIPAGWTSYTGVRGPLRGGGSRGGSSPVGAAAPEPDLERVAVRGE
jgi:hypothetical protein